MPKYKRIVIFGLDRLVGIKDLGIIPLVPLTDRGIGIKSTEIQNKYSLPKHIQQRNALIDVDLLIHMKIF